MADAVNATRGRRRAIEWNDRDRVAGDASDDAEREDVNKLHGEPPCENMSSGGVAE
jgi:hypothetical protein